MPDQKMMTRRLFWGLPLLFLSFCLIPGRQDHPVSTVDVSSEQLAFRIDTVLSGLKVPWAMAWLPNGDMLFTERDGELRLVQDGQLHPDPVKGVPAVRARGQGGLLDIELHPDYGNNGWIYLTYSSPAQEGEEGQGANTALIRARLKDHQLVDLEMIFKALPNVGASHHYGGRVVFDQKGYLYLSVGDRGGQDYAQQLDSYRGKILRLHDDGTIPADNPFVKTAGARPEIFSYGHRNEQGLAIHPETGELWEHEHGPKGGDEINIIRAGRNYGWPVITYGINYDGSIITTETAREGMEQPVTYYVPSIAPCGMAFLSSHRYPAWKGNLFSGSLSFRYLERCVVEDNKITHQEKLLEGIGRVRAIEQGPDGYLYLAVEGPGMIIRLMPE